MNIPEVAHLDVSRFRLREATERLNHQEYDLVSELRAGSEPAFHRFVDLYRSKSATGDDIAQQIFVNAYSSIKGFEGRSSLFTWLHRITVNLSFEFLRKRIASLKVPSPDTSVRVPEVLRLQLETYYSDSARLLEKMAD